MFNKTGFNPETGEWNDSLSGDFVWSNTNIGETVSDVLTPFTWSIISASFEQMNILPQYPVVGNIAGRAYNNTSVLVTGMLALGRDLEELYKEMGGIREEYLGNLDRMMIPLPKPALLPLISRGIKIRSKQKKGGRQIPRFLAENPAWCSTYRERISKINNKDELAEIYRREMEPYTLGTFWMVVSSAWKHGEITGKLRKMLTPLVGVDETDNLLSNVSIEAEMLASLGPAISISQVARGELSPETYLERWGHRGPHETEVSIPRPAEDPEWLPKQLEILSKAPENAESLLSKRQKEFETAWSSFQERFPGKKVAIKSQLEANAEAIRAREAVRSELVRIIWVGRDWALQAGKMTGLGEDIFLLTTEETLDVLTGNEKQLSTIPKRRATYEKYLSLPPYPMIIRGRFNPLAWAADPGRRTDYYDASRVMDQIWAEADQENPNRRKQIFGAPGSAGVVEGRVRLISTPEEGDTIQPGEILVTTQTNIGWSHFFPLLGGVITDVGAALSHAAIVARELGIPAVVNCGNASMRLKTGDRVRLDGGRGIVTILDGDNQP